MLTVVLLVQQPQPKMLDSIQVLTQQSPFSHSHRETEHRGAVRLVEVRLRRESLRLQECSQRVFIIGSNTANIIAIMLRMNTTSSTRELRNGSFWFDSSDSSTPVDTKSISKLSIDSNSVLTKFLQVSRQFRIIRIVHPRIVQNACH